MIMQRWKPRRMGLWLVLTLLGLVSAPAQELARGMVFHDRNGNGLRDAGEEGIPNVRVSNGRDIVLTDAEGGYALAAGDDTVLFMLKPRDWMTPVSSDQLPQFYYLHKPAGSPDLRYAGVAPTGPLPESVDFPLVRRPEPERFAVVAFGDTQPRNRQEIAYIAHDVVAHLIGTEAAFGVTLGDLVFDDLRLFEPLNGVIAQIGIPWYNVIGNHDLNFDAPDNALAAESFKRVYGPTYYAFDYGPVHFVVLNSIWWHGDRYTSRLGEDQLAFLRANLASVDRDRLVVMLMHIPIMQTDERAEVYALLQQFPHRLVLAGHWHRLEHYFLTPDHGWPGEDPLHVLIPGMVCGGWWSGHHDEYGIPHTTLYDGAPNGHGLFTFSGNTYRFEYVPARQPRDAQIAVYAPDTVPHDQAAGTLIQANVFAGSERNTVVMRLGADGPWIPMEQRIAPDPNYVRLKESEQQILALLKEHGITPPAVLGRPIPDPRDSSHLWQATLPAAPSRGYHTIWVRSTDMFGQVHVGRRILCIE